MNGLVFVTVPCPDCREPLHASLNTASGEIVAVLKPHYYCGWGEHADALLDDAIRAAALGKVDA